MFIFISDKYRVYLILLLCGVYMLYLFWVFVVMFVRGDFGVISFRISGLIVLFFLVFIYGFWLFVNFYVLFIEVLLKMNI